MESISIEVDSEIAQVYITARSAVIVISNPEMFASIDP